MFSLIMLVAMVQIITGADNGLVVAEKSSRLANRRLRTIALIFGFLGAAAMNFALLFVGSYIVDNRLAVLVGGCYLIYLALDGLAFRQPQPATTASALQRLGKAQKMSRIAYARIYLGVSQQEKTAPISAQPSLAGVLFAIWMSGLIFSLDNTIAVLAITHSMRILIPGTLLGMIAVFLAAGFLASLLARHPAFSRATYVIIALIGVETIGRLAVSNLVQLSAVSLILAGAFLYERSRTFQKLCRPVFEPVGKAAAAITDRLRTSYERLANRVKKLVG